MFFNICFIEFYFINYDITNRKTIKQIIEI